MEPEEAATTLTRAMAGTKNPHALKSLSEGLTAVLIREASTTRQRTLGVAARVAAQGGPDFPFATLAWIHAAQMPAPPLPPQTLLEILKQPFCVGESRKQVLGQLTRHYGRRFADQWEFVEYANEHKLKLDLTSPPRGDRSR
jgi:hypothetical protein